MMFDRGDHGSLLVIVRLQRWRILCSANTRYGPTRRQTLLAPFCNSDGLLLVFARMQDQERRTQAQRDQDLAFRGATPPEYRSPESQSAVASTPSDLPRSEGNAGRAEEHLQSLDALIEKGSLLHRLGKTEEAIAYFDAARRIAPDHELVLTNLAVALADSGQRHDAVVAFRKILKLNPENEYVRHQLRRLISIIVPFWHARMLNDTARNEAFERAIQAAVAREGPHARILDIGAGSGLLSMMAARAGATNIVACERVPIIAEAAERIVALNGLDQAIRVISKASTDLIVGADLDDRADILVSEIISSDLLAENVLETFQDAHLRLLREGATVIPRAATAVGCLVESEVLDKYAAVNVVSGFDVSPFTELAPSRLPVHGVMTSWRRLSDDFDLVRIDLTDSEHQAVIHKHTITVREDGQAVGVVQWINLDLADGISFSNHPDRYFDGGWLQVLHTFPSPIPVVKGQELDLLVGHDRISLIMLPSSQTPA
jgi:predicted RNA methylase